MRSDYQKVEIKEVFQDLAQAVRNLSLDRGIRSFLVTGSLPGEGASWTAFQLSSALQQVAGTRILLADANFRNPGFGSLMHTSSETGLVQLLSTKNSLPDYSGDFVAIPSGDVSPDSSMLLGSNRMQQIISEWEKKYDFVVFDAAPVIPYADSIVMSRMTGGTLLVVEAGGTRSEVVRKAKEKLQDGGCESLRIILNKYRKAIPQFVYRFL
jgi:capsular exopolysaccharide synthesis family protein